MPQKSDAQKIINNENNAKKYLIQDQNFNNSLPSDYFAYS